MGGRGVDPGGHARPLGPQRGGRPESRWVGSGEHARPIRLASAANPKKDWRVGSNERSRPKQSSSVGRGTVHDGRVPTCRRESHESAGAAVGAAGSLGSARGGRETSVAYLGVMRRGQGRWAPESEAGDPHRPS